MFGRKRDKIVKMLHQLDLETLDQSSIQSIRIAFNDLFEGHDAHMLNTKYAYDIVDNTKIVVFEWALDINIPTVFVSDNISQFGFTPEDFYSGHLKDYWDFVHPDDRERIKSNLHEARKIGDVYTHTYRILTALNEVRWVEERIIYEKDESGALVHEKGILIDITDFKKLQAQVESSRERYRRIFENSSVIIFTVDLNGTINTVNKMFTRILGYRSEEITGHLLEEILVHLRDIDNVLSFSKSDIGESLDVDVFCKDGSIKTLNVSTNIIDSTQEEFEIVAVDVSEKKKDEQKIRYLSYHDKLTDVYNRAYFDEFIKDLDEDERYPFSIIIGDMNGLKELNDNFGHKSGDQMLVDVALICKKACREQDKVCRIGGDEFAIICTDTDEIGARKVCKRIRELCKETHVDGIGHPSIALGFSTKKSKAVFVDQLIKEADDNMYKNKMTSKQSMSGLYIGALQTMLEKNSLESKNHSKRLKNLAMTFGQHLQLSHEQIDDLKMVALMHDIGLVGVPDHILLKPDVLTDEEYEQVKLHTYIGANILNTVAATEEISELILYHHEHYNGQGYPEGLKGNQIPYLSRIISILDAFDIMTSGTVYKDSVSTEAAIKELKRCAGTQFDPNIVDAFIDFMG
jgi:diguanylate cyclase (GGDEF)-like protein/PAS domain S-box-containing protein